MFFIVGELNLVTVIFHDLDRNAEILGGRHKEAWQCRTIPASTD